VEVQGFEPWSGSAMVTLSTRLEEHYIQIWQAVLLTNQTYSPCVLFMCQWHTHYRPYLMTVLMEMR